MDYDLKYALANMVAVVLGCEPQSNHLWYHLFGQKSLFGTYLTGFLYNRVVGSSGFHYDCGVELTHDGKFGRTTYAGRWNYNIDFLYFLLLVNFGSFCVALLTQQDANSSISGPLISHWLPVRQYCVSQLRTAWMHLKTTLKLSREKQNFFVMNCLKSFYKVRECFYIKLCNTIIIVLTGV